MTGDRRRPWELLADELYGESDELRQMVRETLEDLDLFVCSGEALAEVLELALRQGATDAALHQRSGVVKLLRLVLGGSDG